MNDVIKLADTRSEPELRGRWNIRAIVDALRDSRDVSHSIRRDRPARQAPSRDSVERIVKDLTVALFPRHYGRTILDSNSIDYFVGNSLNDALNALYDEVVREQSFVSDNETDQIESDRALEIVREFSAKLPDIRGLLVSDLRSAFVGDPAATSFPEILIGYPGMLAIIHHRLAHVLYQLGTVIVARLFSELAHTKTGIDIHPGARIGSGFFIDHGTGVVIGETAIIGNRVRIYQAVTLGARDFPTDRHGHVVKGNQRHPILEDDVVVYAGATILGRVTIGQGSIIGGNVWLTEDVPSNSFITQASHRSRKNAG